MRKGIVPKAIIFIVLFITSALLVNKVYYSGFENSTYDTTNTTLPVVYLRYNDDIVDRMLAYTDKINTSLLRDTIIPVGDERKVSILVPGDKKYANKVSYELRSLDGKILIEDGDLTDTIRYNGFAQYDIKFRMNIANDKEYVLVVKLIHEEKTLRYYTRVVKLDRDYLQDYLDFAKEFNAATFPDKYDENGEISAEFEEPIEGIIVDNLKSRSQATNSSNLGHVTLDASYDIITYGKMNPYRTSEVVPTIKEFSKDDCIIEYRYTLSSGKDEAQENFVVSEFYELSYSVSKGKIVINKYERNMDTVFVYKDVDTIVNALNFGSNSKSAEVYKTTEDMKKVAFVSEGQLWYYNYRNTIMSNIYGYWRGQMADIQEIQNKAGISILNITDDGIVDFLVYGRIPRGTHEGRNGVILYEFSEETSDLTELLYIETDLPYDILNLQVGSFAYYNNETNLFYTIINDSLIQVDTVTDKETYLIENMPLSKIHYSADKSVIAYMNNNDIHNTTGFTIIDCATNTVTPKNSEFERLSIIGFVDHDVVYGDGLSSDIYESDIGIMTMAYKKINIIDKDGKLIKNYDKPGTKLINVAIGDNVISFDKVGDEDIRRVTGSDYISFKHEKVSSKIAFKNYVDEKGYFTLKMVFPINVYIRRVPSLVLTKTKINEAESKVTILQTSENIQSYVFLYEGLDSAYDTEGTAVKKAIEDRGVVMDGSGTILYKNRTILGYNSVAGTFDYQKCNTIDESISACIYMSILASGGSADYGEVLKIRSWKEGLSLSESAIPINLARTDLTTGLAYISAGVPITVKMSDGRYVLVVSYNRTAIRYYDPVLGEEQRVGRVIFENDMAVSGNVIYTFATK